MKYRIVEARGKHVNEVIEILNGVMMEIQNINPLITDINIEKKFKNQFMECFDANLGFVAIKDKKVVGYLFGFQINKEFFGSSKGVYVPLYGHGTVKEDRQKIYQSLYTYASGVWVKNGLINHVITMFCENKACVNTWMLMGFGNRCCDGIRTAEPISKIIPQDYKIIKAEKEDLNLIYELCYKDGMHFKKVPAFMVGYDKSMEQVINNFNQWFSKSNRHVWIALYKEKPIGYMRIGEEGESFISENSRMMNITGAFVDEENRGKGIAACLLDNVLIWLNNNDYTLCGVDFESINIIASSFWNKYFHTYTYSMLRCIDDRILDEDMENL